MAISRGIPTTTDPDLLAVFRRLDCIEPHEEPMIITGKITVCVGKYKGDGAVLIITEDKTWLHMTGGYASVRGNIGGHYSSEALAAVEIMRDSGLITEAQFEAFGEWVRACGREATEQEKRYQLDALAEKFGYALVKK